MRLFSLSCFCKRFWANLLLRFGVASLGLVTFSTSMHFLIPSSSLRNCALSSGVYLNSINIKYREPVYKYYYPYILLRRLCLIDCVDIKAYRKELRRWYTEKKQKEECAFCHKKQSLQYHHVNPANKVDTVSNLVHKCVDKYIIEKEMDKCIVLCKKCHRKWHEKHG